jgi:hypothetical protein
LLKFFCALLTSFACLPIGQAAPAQNVVPRLRNAAVINEADWAVLADEPAKYLAKAKENVLKRDLQAASSDLRKAAVFIKGATSVAAADTKIALSASAKELEALAVELAQGSESAIAKVDGTIARAVHALALHHSRQAEKSMARKAFKGAGHYLRAATNEVEQGALWTGHELEAGAAATLRGARKVGGKLIQGSGILVDETGKAIGFVGTEVAKLGKRIKPNPAAPASK